MLLGIVSDTHGHVDYTRAAVCLLESLEVDAVIHCGDIGATSIVGMFAAWPTHYVFGNVDDNHDALRCAIATAGHQCHDRFGSVELAGRRIAFLHGDDTRRLAETIASGEWDLVCYGHTHQASEEWRGKTLSLNPGAVFRADPHSIAVVRLPELSVEIVPT